VVFNGRGTRVKNNSHQGFRLLNKGGNIWRDLAARDNHSSLNFQSQNVVKQNQKSRKVLSGAHSKTHLTAAHLSASIGISSNQNVDSGVPDDTDGFPLFTYLFIYLFTFLHFCFKKEKKEEAWTNGLGRCISRGSFNFVAPGQIPLWHSLELPNCSTCLPVCR